jgi:hypothetical protein
MSSSESGSDSSSSSSDDSDNERSTNCMLVIPSPIIPSDSEDDGVSPSQHKLAIKKQLAYHHVVPISTSGSMQMKRKKKMTEKSSLFWYLLMLNLALRSN